ncbi:MULTISPECIES: heavy-metal-associated domain-containing protein [Gordonibacter]|uniref:HMA domain-containing protein n=1 Tax=Gordonibacter urolithinfaciens TaxID=1335613 RepID=A0A6N8IGK1_9ACTN|nr:MULTISPECIES: heavy-metal-associated domain-containing protein [Gordonibacter]MDN4507987.1 heavy-metal-associated domain-containing protein [Gordonibacter sp. RACS_AR49]MVM54264.1 hypothetical protein [Gordonibacter urolithinfaciens]MVN14520.1 hypothetical protein [Gordonibacter urolithinfaciens]MVN37689.1 hypothetical protein [Gordonibacter urolithinfaciens]MVN56315.1 hypothetical protein [Gordonibacter urolithinfaciens]
MTVETLKVTGMHCPKCTARVEKAVGVLDGVMGVAADFEADKVELTYDGQPSTLAAVKAAIAAEDFVVEK